MRRRSEFRRSFLQGMRFGFLDRFSNACLDESKIQHKGSKGKGSKAPLGFFVSRSLTLRPFDPLCFLLCYFAIAFLASQFGPAVLAQGLSTVGDYANRLERAKQAMDEVIEQNIPAPGACGQDESRSRRLAPASEDVEFNGSIIRVDNAWLHDAVNNVIKNAGGDIEQRRSMLREISDRLARLKQSVNEPQTTQDQDIAGSERAT